MPNEFIIKNGFISQGNSIVNGSLTATTYYGDGSNLTGVPNFYVTGGTYSNGTLTLNRQNGSVTITGFTTGFTIVDTYVTGFTYDNSNKLTVSRNNGLSDINVYLNQFSGLTVNGIVSATTFNGSGIGLNNIPISGVTNLQNSLDSKFSISGGTVTGDVLVLGNVTILGTATTINTTTLTVQDNIITLNSNATGSTSPLPINSGIEILRNSGTTASVLWEETNGYWSAGLNGSTKKIILEGDSLALLTSGHTHPISEINGLQTVLNNKFDTSGGTITGSVLINGSLTATTYYGDGSNLTGLVTNDFYVTGGTYSNGTLTLDRQNGSVTITGFTSSVSETCTVDTTSTYGLEYKKITTISGLTQGSYIIKSYVTSFSGTSKYGFWERTLGVVTDGSTPVITKSTEDFDKYSSNFVPSQIVYTPTAGNNIEVYLSGLTSENLNWTSYYEVVGQNCNGGVGATTVTNNTSGVQINDLFSYQFLLMGA